MALEIPSNALLPEMIEIGDVVMLRSGGLPMTVSNVCDCGSISTIWFEGGDEAGWFGPYEGDFDEFLLEVVG